jgi:hypothetical protein
MFAREQERFEMLFELCECCPVVRGCAALAGIKPDTLIRLESAAAQSAVQPGHNEHQAELLSAGQDRKANP